MDDALRRRSVGAPAARSALLTVLGEYVLGAREGVWQETLISALGMLGYRTQAARQALARSATAGGAPPGARAQRHGGVAADGAPRQAVTRPAHRGDGGDAVRGRRADLRLRRAVGGERALAAGGPARAGGAPRDPPPDADAAGVGGLRLDRRRAVDQPPRRARGRPARDERRRRRRRAAVVPRRVGRSRRRRARDRRRVGPRRRRRRLPRVHRRVPPAASQDAGGNVPRPDRPRARVAQVPVPGPRSAGSDAPGLLPALPRPRAVRRASRALARA